MNAIYTSYYHSLCAKQLYDIVCLIDPNISRFSFDYYKETNARNNRGICSLKGNLLSMVHIDEAIKHGLIDIN